MDQDMINCLIFHIHEEKKKIVASRAIQQGTSVSESKITDKKLKPVRKAAAKSLSSEDREGSAVVHLGL